VFVSKITQKTGVDVHEIWGRGRLEKMFTKFGEEVD